MADKVIVSRDKLVAIANAVRGKTGNADALKLDEIASAVTQLPLWVSMRQELLNKSGFLGGMFAYTSLSDVSEYLVGLDTSRANSSWNMFQSARYMRTAPFFDTSKITDGSSMFASCVRMTTIPQYNFESLLYGSQLFYNCNELTEAPDMNIVSATSLSQAFDACYKLTSAVIGRFNFSSTTGSNALFRKCYSLKKLVIREVGNYVLSSNAFSDCYHLTGTVNATYNPEGMKDGFIYVPDDMVETLKTAANWSVYATQIKGLSELEIAA